MQNKAAFIHHMVDQKILDDLSDDEFNEAARWVVPVLPDIDDDDDDVSVAFEEPARLYEYQPAPRAVYVRRR